ncbi:hypothetical protein, partial [Candidatus Megaera venefica]|uniref:hypothetical protein n=1 Tax=Candidatus Megaera venefica TaxID=2055910 RepID=UPI002AD28D14
MLLNQEIGMLAVLLSGILESYLEYKAKKTWVAYAARFFAFLAMTLRLSIYLCKFDYRHLNSPFEFDHKMSH